MTPQQQPLHFERWGTMRERFEIFHAANPHVYERLAVMALKLQARGRKHYGMKTLFEVLRYEHDLRTTAGDSFKLNNNYTPFYARLLMERWPQLEGFFATRSSQADR